MTEIPAGGHFAASPALSDHAAAAAGLAALVVATLSAYGFARITSTPALFLSRRGKAAGRALGVLSAVALIAFVVIIAMVEVAR